MAGEKRYRSLRSYLQSRYPHPVRKISIDAGFTCPNRNGTLGEGGCTYCRNESFVPGPTDETRPERATHPDGKSEEMSSPDATHVSSGRIQFSGPTESISSQIERGQEKLRKRLGVEHAVAYFQAYTNTYAPVDVLKSLYDEAVSVPGIVGLSIGTRPDCVSDEVMALLECYVRDDFEVWLEIGLQSAHDRTLQEINRGHGVAEFLDAVTRAKKHRLRVCAHVILGLPNETREEMIETAKVLTMAGIDGVKIHPLHVVRGTVLEETYEMGEYTPLELEEYVSLVCEFLERLSPDIVVHRLTGEAQGDTLVAPFWCKAKSSVLEAIDRELDERDSYQGKFSAFPISKGDITIEDDLDDIP
jgi:radical SAM protein (TIGR01212 family)